MSKILFIIFYFAINHSYSQTPFNSARLTTMIGSHVTFNFNSISDFNSGIIKNNHTMLGVHFVDSSGGVSVSGWNISVKASDANFEASGGANTMNLDVLEIKATDAGSVPALGGNFTGWQILTIGEVNLYEHPTREDRFSTSTQVNISYQCGVTNKIIGSNSDYYETELEIYLRPTP
jgi:hypothetical protein